MDETLETLQTEADSLVDETPVVEVTDGAVTEEATEAVVLVTPADLYAVRDDLLHADLFGSFLVCGTLVGIALCWRLTK